MKLQFLGSGTAFTSLHENFNSNMAFFSDTGRCLMIDCGSDARHSTAALNLGYKDFDAIFISHLHADHAGGLEWMGLTRKFDPTATKPKLVIHPSMVTPLWEHVLCGGLQTIKEQACDLETFFDLYPLIDDTHFIWENIPFELVQTIHIFHNHTLVPSYGLFFKANKTNIFLTTDTQFEPDRYMIYYEKADIIFHDCETTAFKSSVHAHYTDLMTLPPHIRAKMWLYHYLDTKLFDPLAHGFLGFVKRGQSFTF